MKKINTFASALLISIIFTGNISFATNEMNSTIYSNHELNSSLNEKEIYNSDDLQAIIQQTIDSSNYQNSDSYFRGLYDISIENANKHISFNEEDNHATSFAYNNFLKEIEKIEQLKNQDPDILKDINTESIFYNDPKYTIAYLNLDKSLQDELDSMKIDSKNKFLTLSELENSLKYSLPIFYYEFPYQFMQDRDRDGMVGEWNSDVDKLFKTKSLKESYRESSQDQRNYIRTLDTNKNGFIDLVEIEEGKISYNDDSAWIVDFIPDKDKDSFKNKNEDTIQEEYQPEINYPTTKLITDTPDISTDKEINDDEKFSSYKYDSIFYIKNRTRSYYENLSEEQRLELDALNLDGDGYLSIEELETSDKYNLPINSNNWLYPFMYDKNNDGKIDEDDRNSYDYPEKEYILDENSKSNVNDDLYQSPFYKNSKTRQAYLDLTDEQRNELDNMNTDGKYPLTVEEVIVTGKFDIPIKKDRDWIYPFMVDKNNDGEIGESYEYYKENEPVASNYPNTSYEEINTPTQSETITTTIPIVGDTTATVIKQPKSYSNQSEKSVKAANNAKTGISALKTISKVLLIAGTSLFIMKKYNWNPNQLS